MLKELGYPNASVVVGNRSKTPDPTADFNIRRVKNNSHAQLGNNYGYLTYEPYRYGTSEESYTGMNGIVFLSITITLGERR